jgi:hypothetical protein
MPRPNSEGNRILLLRYNTPRRCCPKRSTDIVSCVCATCVTCPLTFVPSTDYTVGAGRLIQKISSNPDATLVTTPSYSYQNVCLNLTYTVDITVPQVIVGFSPTQSFDDVIYTLIIDSAGLTIAVDGLTVTLSADSSSAPYWSNGRIIRISLTTQPDVVPGSTRLNMDIDNGDNVSFLKQPIDYLYPSICGFYGILKFPTVNTSMVIDYFGLSRPCH